MALAALYGALELTSDLRVCAAFGRVVIDSLAAQLHALAGARATDLTTMTLAELLAFMRSPPLAVEASCGPDGRVQAALVGIAVRDTFDIVFDTLGATRKARNLRASGHAAFVLGGWLGTDERTVQVDGIADEPTGTELEQMKAAYFAVCPMVVPVRDGRVSPISGSARHGFGTVILRQRPR